jgi:O-antigen/teichoic acid export membrane protein
VYGVGVSQLGIIRPTRWNPVSLIALAVLVLPFAINGRTEGLVLAVIVWVVVAVLLVWWWRGRHEPRPPDHAV